MTASNLSIVSTVECRLSRLKSPDPIRLDTVKSGRNVGRRVGNARNAQYVVRFAQLIIVLGSSSTVILISVNEMRDVYEEKKIKKRRKKKKKKKK